MSGEESLNKPSSCKLLLNANYIDFTISFTV